MKAFITFSVRHPVSVISILLVIVLLGAVSALSVPVDFLPVMSPRLLLVAAEYPGISAREMRSMVTVPLEDAFASLKGLKVSSSVTRDGLSLLTLELHWGTDIDVALVESREIIDLCYETLPTGCIKPIVSENDTSFKDTLTILCVPKDNDLRYSRYIAETDIKPRLQRLGGVGGVTVSGGEKEQIQVRVYRDELEARKLTVQALADTISGANFEYPAGTIREGEKELSVKTSGLYTSIDDINNTPLVFNNGGLVRIKDIADVVRTTERKESFFLFNALECIRIGVQKKPDSSPLVVSSQVKRELDILRQAYGSWYDFEVTGDLADQIKSSLLSLALSAGIGMLAAGLVVNLFLKYWKFSLVISSIIPLSTLFSTLVLMICGKTLNSMSLSGIAIGIGMVIDAGTVVVENIQHNLDKKDISTLIIESTGAVAMSNTGSALTTIIVFIPVFFIKGLLGELFADMAIAVISSIGISCVLSLSYIPALCTLIVSAPRSRRRESGCITAIEKKYSSVLKKLLSRPRYVLLLLVINLGIGVVFFFFIDYRLLPELSTKYLNADITFPPGTSLGSIRHSADEISGRLNREAFIKNVQISGGVEHDDYRTLALPDEEPEKIRMTLEIDIPIAEGISRIESIFSGSPFNIIFSPRQDTLSQLLEIRNDVYIIRSETPETVLRQAVYAAGDSGKIIPNVTVTESVFTPDRLAGARFSVSAQYMASVARDTLEGVFTVSYYEKGREIPILVKLRDEDIHSVADLENTMVQFENAYIPLRVLGSITDQTNEKVLYRYNRMDAKQLLDYTTPDTPLNMVTPGREDLREMANNGIFLLIATILLLYFVMGAQFESFIIPFLMLIALPPAFSGAILFLFLTNNSMNINSIIALVILFGISINNSILLYESCHEAAVITKSSIIVSCRKKLRAILITNLTTIIALVPFAIDPAHSSAQSSLSIAIIGGLLFSVILVLFVVPFLFLHFLPGRRPGNA
jgi:multidrug efflux pump subunit AcrB